MQQIGNTPNRISQRDIDKQRAKLNRKMPGGALDRQLKAQHEAMLKPKAVQKDWKALAANHPKPECRECLLEYPSKYTVPPAPIISRGMCRRHYQAWWRKTTGKK